jgi:ABC-type dipeptide/oligopeptide/nickel transport system ATPase component
VLEIEDFSLIFETGGAPVRALRNVTLSVPQREIVGIVGESGSGKSTLALAVIGLLAANARILSGQVIFDGRDLLTLDEDAMRSIRGKRIAMVFQDPMTSLNPVRTVGQQMLDIQHHDRESGTPRCRTTTRQLHFPVFRRHAPAHCHCHGHDAEARGAGGR